MFFIVSKILYFIITPIVWFFTAMVWAFFTKNSHSRKKIIGFTTLALYIFSNTFIVDECIRSYEIQTKHIDSLQCVYDYGIVLGGFNTFDAQFNRIQFNKASDRLWQAILLYKKGKIKKIFISGGEGKIITEGYTESETTRDFLIDIGIAPHDIVIENKSKNTYQNAVYSAQLLKNHSCLLITSAIHMPRAFATFTKAGIKCEPFSTDRITGKRKFVFDYCFIPNMQALEYWRIFLRELIGYAIYKIMCYA
jgi:uncharacterized SAM-binding protein YcdF (DUF218 family)